MNPGRGDRPLVLVPMRTGLGQDHGGGAPLPLQTVNGSYLSALQAAGALPVGVPVGTAQMDSLGFAQGLLLPGGADVEPGRYRADPHPRSEPDPRVDALEFPLLEWALARELPVLGICRGLQVINVFMGGSLVQDLPTLRPGAVAHPHPGPRNALAHDFRILSGTLLADLIGDGQIAVNSLHHQGVERVGPGLRVSATSSDGLVEGLEDGAGRWLVAVQFHPEELYQEHAHAQRLFRAFVRACSSRAPAPLPA